MQYNILGRTGLKVSAVSFGTSPLGDMFGSADEATALDAVHCAVDAGINFFDSSPYYGQGLAERRLGRAVSGIRDEVLIGTKAGRNDAADFDFSPAAIRASLERSLELLGTDYVDVFQLHDIEFVSLDGVFGDAYAELVTLRDEGKCRFIGMTGYPMRTLTRAVTETDLDVVLSYAHFTLLNTELETVLAPVCREQDTAVINAAAVGLGLLTKAGLKIDLPAPRAILDAARAVSELCSSRGVDVSFLANQFSIQRSGCATTVIGTTKAKNLDAAVDAVTAPIDDELLADVLAITADVRSTSWISGLPENN
ncbi:aldo/keto reductase [Rhodococcoides kyotonense]|uniref:L-galactose dehydrogenase n=1 Tax=Rhodococcoides kyotonense TaxID=398843 RepID=A0A239JSJ8_9NOCA|nr:aldo/keto reductase [Rhodococcus kyotonensis]SNT08827.1 L-galactose dehydrogenase [Rhodococcus kyotonensis]